MDKEKIEDQALLERLERLDDLEALRDSLAVRVENAEPGRVWVLGQIDPAILVRLGFSINQNFLDKCAKKNAQR
jgi:hypothetical protein